MKSFEFAGFHWPRRIVELPKGTPRARLDDKRTRSATYNPRVSPYLHAPKPRQAGDVGRGFYHGDAGMPDLRWEWADDIAPRSIHHRGWYTDDDGIGETMRGIVFRLPKGRGFLYGWSMGPGMAAEITGYEPVGGWDPSRYGDAIEQAEHFAAMAADGAAERAAEKEREYQRAWSDGREYADALEEAERERKAYRDLARALGEAVQSHGKAAPIICAELRAAFGRHVAAARDALSRARELRDDAPTWSQELVDAWNEGAGSEVLA